MEFYSPNLHTCVTRFTALGQARRLLIIHACVQIWDDIQDDIKLRNSSLGVYVTMIGSSVHSVTHAYECNVSCVWQGRPEVKHRASLSLLQEYQLIVSGHSLGAGVASVLALLLRKHFPDLHCYAFSPPGCVFRSAHTILKASE